MGLHPIKLNLHNDRFNLETGMTSYENLQKGNSDRYEFILPYYNLSAELNDGKEYGYLNFSSVGSNILKDTNNLRSRIINDFDFRKIDGTLKLLCDSMGKCERIKNTEFPTQYSLYTRVFLYVFLILLPLAIVESMGYYTVLIQFLTGFTFIMIQNIAFSLQDPFENNASDIPVFAISRTIERNLLEMTGEKNLPEDWKAENNVLM